MDNNLDIVISKKAIIQSLQSKIDSYSNKILSDIGRVKEVEKYFNWFANEHTPKLKEVNKQFLNTLLTLVTKRSVRDHHDTILINQLVDSELTVSNAGFLEEPTLDKFHTPQELDFIRDNKSYLERVINPLNNPQVSDDAFSYVKLLISINHYSVLKSLCDTAQTETITTEIIESHYHTNFENSFSLYDLTVEQAVLTHKHNRLHQIVQWMDQEYINNTTIDDDIIELEARKTVTKALQEVLENIEILIDNPEFQITDIPLCEQRKMIKRFYIGLSFPLSQISFKGGDLTTFCTFPTLDGGGRKLEITFQIVNPLKPFFSIRSIKEFLEVGYDGSINSSYYNTYSEFDSDVLDTLLQLFVPITEY